MVSGRKGLNVSNHGCRYYDMSDTAMLTITFKVPGETVSGLSRGHRSAYIRDAIEEKKAREKQAVPALANDPLLKLMEAARQEYQAGGGRLLSFSEVAEEMARRRGEP